MAEIAQTDDFMDFEKSLLGTSAATPETTEEVIEDASSNIAEEIIEEPAAEAESATETAALTEEPEEKEEPEESAEEAATEVPEPAAEVTEEAPTVEESPEPETEAPVEKEEPAAETVEVSEEGDPIEEETAEVEEPTKETTSDDEDDDDDDDFDILNIFSEQASSSELGAGVHERVRLISVSGERRKDANGNLVKKQFFLKFKKFSKDDVDLGEKEVSFFLVDASKETAINNLINFTSQVKELLSLFYSPSELADSFDPFKRVFYNPDNDDRDEKDVEADFDYTKIKKNVIKNEKGFIAIQTAICTDAAALLTPFCGFDGPMFRLKLVESDDNKYIEIPRFDAFVEKAGVSKENSVLYKE